MASTLLILAVASAALVLVWSLLCGSKAGEIHSVQEWDEKKVEIDVQIFRLLLDPKEERYLRNSLSRAQFRRFQRKRIRLALRMLRLVEVNTGMLLSLGQIAKTKSDPLLERTADELVNAAIHLRFKLVFARLSLFVKWLWPNWNLAVPIIEERYQHLLDGLAHFRQGGEHNPA
jgi:hypothetical protein